MRVDFVKVKETAIISIEGRPSMSGKTFTCGLVIDFNHIFEKDITKILDVLTFGFMTGELKIIAKGGKSDRKVDLDVRFFGGLDITDMLDVIITSIDKIPTDDELEFVLGRDEIKLLISAISK